jgi:fibronectin type 3 domain-containing protein
VPSQDIPTAPSNLVTIPGVYHINISWISPASDGGSPILHYSIYRGITSGGETFLAQVNFDVTSYTDNSVSSGFTYYYRVSASNAIGESPLSNEDSAMPLSEPMEPTGLTGTSGDSYVNLTWSAPAQDGGSPIITYSIYRNGSFYDSVPGNQKWYNDTSVLNDVIYTYTVSATNNIGEGALSSSWATTKTVPTAPHGLQSNEGDGYVLLTWSAPSDDGGLNIIGYNIYRDSVLIDTVTGNQLYWNDTTVVNGVTYTYKVSANNSLGESLFSSEVDGTPMAKPSAPLNLQVEDGDGYVYLTWSVPVDDGGSAVVEYHIYRNGALLDTVSTGQLWFNDTKVVNGVTYTYSISANNDAGEGPESSGLDAIPLGRPSAPQNLKVSAGDGYVNITWYTPSTNGGSTITKYIIYRGATSGGESYLVEVGDVYYYNDTDVTNSETYYYKVSAINSQGEGAMSSGVSATPEAPTPSINQPPVATILTPSSGATLSGTFLFSGTALDSDGTVQWVEIRIDDGVWIMVNGTTSWDYEWDTTTVANGEHSIRIRVYDGTDYSQEIDRSVIINNPAEEEPTEEDMTWLLLLIILIVVITLILILLLAKRKKPEEKEIEEEVPKPIPHPPSKEGDEDKTEGDIKGGEDEKKAETSKHIPPPPPPPPPHK